MSKKCKIDCCAICPYMDNEYYDYASRCTLLDKKLNDIHTGIYKDCPLKDWDENEEEIKKE